MLGRTASIAFLAAALIAGISCASNQSEKPKAPAGLVTVVNTICPLRGDDFGYHTRATDLAREWKGTNIGFCCEDCPPEFDKLTDAEKDNARALALANKAPAKAPH